MGTSAWDERSFPSGPLCPVVGGEPGGPIFFEPWDQRQAPAGWWHPATGYTCRPTPDRFGPQSFGPQVFPFVGWP